jgi:hypothetical protein
MNLGIYAGGVSFASGEGSLEQFLLLELVAVV